MKTKLTWQRVAWWGGAILLLTGIVLTPNFGGGQPIALPPGTLSADELLRLFSDKTVYSVTAVRKRESVSYYASSGELLQMRNGVKRTGHWRVTANDRICLQMENLPEKCRIVVKEDGEYKKYIVKKNGRHQHSVSYVEFRDGNPLGL